MRSCGFLWAVSIPLCFEHHTGHTSCTGLRAKERPRAHAPLALLGLPSDKPSFDTCPLGHPHPEAKQQKVKPGHFRVPSAVGQLQERGSAGKPEPRQQEVKKKRLLLVQVLGFLHGHKHCACITQTRGLRAAWDGPVGMPRASSGDVH